MSRTVTLLGVLILAGAGVAASLAVSAAGSGGARHAGQTAHAAGAAGSSSTAAKVSVADFAPASFRFAKAAEDQEESEAAAPIQLTASDGTGLSLVALDVNGVLEPPLAFTEIHMTFENPRDATIEGRFRIALPPGAALSRFAMKIGGGWQEGEVVERQRARVAYEDFLHRRQDPALLEQEAGNEFSARVFPIRPRERKELIVSYSHAMPRADEAYTLPLLGLSEVGQLDIRVLLGTRPVTGAASGATSNLGGEVSDRRVVELHKTDWTPDRDFAITQDRVAGRAGLRQGNLAVVRVAAPAAPDTAVPQEIAGLYVLVDSSASRALGYAAQVRRLTELIDGLRDGAGGATPVGIAAFDQEVAPIFEGRADGFGKPEIGLLEARRPLGASDLEGALSWLAGRLPSGGHTYPRVLLITDGVATAGATETRALKAAVHALGASGVERLDVLAVGGLRDEGVLRELTTGNLTHDGQRLDGDAPLAAIARRLTLASRSGIKVAIDGAAWVWPETLDGVQPGDETLVYADLPAQKPLRVTLAGRPVQLDGELVPAERPLLERAWAQARIEKLVHLRESALGSDDDLRRGLALQITELSVKHRVLSPFTAMLVLESEFDYSRFGLDQKALADILTVGAGGLEVLNRTRIELPADSRIPAAAKRAAPELEEAETEMDAGAEAPTDLEDGVEGGVEGGVVGGVAGGVAGGTPGGVPSGVAAAPSMAMPPPPPPPPSPSVQAVEIPDEAPPRIAAPEGRAEESVQLAAPRPEPEPESKVAPYTGRFADVMRHLAAGKVKQARALAESWSAEEPGDVLALLALGEAWEAAGEKTAAARAYGSLIDLFPSRVDMRRLAGERLERLGSAGLDLAIDTYRKAVEDRPDHPSGHRLLAWALLRAGHFEAAFEALEKGLEQDYPGGRFAGADRVMKEDLGLLAAAWLHAEPSRRRELAGRLRDHDAKMEDEPSLRFVLSWETDANDVDLHIYDRKGGHAFYSQKTLPSGGALYEDVTTGYGPECFTVRSPEGKGAQPYHLRVHYYSRGPMGYGMGTVQIVRHDGKGGFTIDPRPFVVMADQAMVDLGSVKEGKEEREGGR
jgi:tetratricopeptide (TPR) repeat protein